MRRGLLATKWFSRMLQSFLSAKKKKGSLLRTGSSLLRLASSTSERNVILKMMYEQAKQELQRSNSNNSTSSTGSTSSSSRSSSSSDEDFQSMSSSRRSSYQIRDHDDEDQDIRGLQLAPHTNHHRWSQSPRNLRVYAVTWNMNGKLPYSSLPKLLENGRGDYDFYVIGLQEAPGSSLRKRLHSILGRQYILMAKTVMGSLQLYVFGRASLQHLVSGKKVDKVRFKGLGGVVGRQKGAVAASLRIGNSSFLFIASHFAAHESKVNERNVQYLRAREKMFSRSTAIPSGSNPCVGPARTDSIQDEPNNLVDGSDVVIWLGDLNYRIEGSRGLVKSFVKLNLERLLWKRDQLSNAVDKGQVFNGFMEGPLAFKPTYKYDVGTDNYDTSDKERVPAWTDRILIKVKEESSVNVDVENYYSIDAMRTSDHRPVKALLHVNLS